MTLSLDQAGYPVLLAMPSKPAKVLPQRPSPTLASSRPDAVQPLEWARRGDLVREVAREFEQLSEQDVRERLKGLTSRPLEDGEIQRFRDDVRVQQLDDLLDALDQAHRGIKRARRTVRIQAPRGYTRKTLTALDPTEMSSLSARLQARGWSDKDLEASGVALPDTTGVRSPQNEASPTPLPPPAAAPQARA